MRSVMVQPFPLMLLWLEECGACPLLSFYEIQARSVASGYFSPLASLASLGSAP